MNQTCLPEQSTDEFHDSLEFSAEVQGYPTRHASILRDDVDILIYANRSRNQEGEWTVRHFRVLGDGISVVAEDADRADLATVLIEVFDPDRLTTDDDYRQQTPIREGIPTVVAVDGKPAICAWLYAVQGLSRDELTEQMGVQRATITEYLSRVRCRGDGLPNGLDIPTVGEVVETMA